jgi:endonuclease/exonuclease/phosphatase family metal-dependent hydrolase
MLSRAPGGVCLPSLLLGLALLAPACGDDAPGGGGGADAASGGAGASAPTTGGDGAGAPGAGGGAAQGGSAAQGGGDGGATGAGGGTGLGGGATGGGEAGGGVGDGGAGAGGAGQGGSAEGGAGQGGAADGGGGPGAGGGPAAGGERLRVIAGNLTSGNNQSWDPGHGKRILQGLAGDVLLLQELRVGNGSAAALRDFVDDVCGASCDVAREPIGGAGDLPNGVVSRHPIVAAGVWDDPEVSNRELFWARIDLPGSRDLLAISVHLLTSSATDRRDEAQALVARLDDAVEPDDLVVLGGDFNTDGRDEAALQVLSAWFHTDGPWPVDTDGDGDTNANRSKPYDWVLANADLDALAIPVVVGARTFASGLVVDTRTYPTIGDLAPALAGDSGAPSMQHMAVVRDFAIDDD